MNLNFDTYIKSIQADLRRGHATEYTYRGALETYMESLGRGINATNDPRHIDVGAPDFIVEKGRVPLGYVETKDIGVPLDAVERSEQMKRYLPALHNLILTDYLEFRWYVNGQRKNTIRIAEPGPGGRLIVTTGADLLLEAFFSNFYATETPTVRSPKELAQRLAGITHFVRDQIVKVLAEGAPELKEALNGQYNAFTDLLLPNLKTEEFADLYAQAMTYGLFAAKLSAPKDAVFTFEDAYKYLRGNPFMRQLFQDVDRNIEGIAVIRPYLQDVVSLLNRSERANVLDGFGRQTRTEDPVVHFYETFLAAYDPKLRESRGVYYTPEPVVQFIVRSVDELLKTRFDKPWGLADDSVKVLDPACGTGTFLYFVIQQIHDEIVNTRRQAGQWAAKSRAMLKRVFGFELLLPPYVVSHLKLDRLMETLGAPVEGSERLHVYLTNSLEEGVERADQLAGLGLNIARESSEAAKVKRDDDIMVVLGNPPYSNFGKMNKGDWILKLLEDYKKNLNEQKININDDFIKFIRFGQWRIDRTGQGILSFITNNTYINGITHRRMRESLLKTFDEIFIFDLHGSHKKKEISPDGLPDENVFDIQTGVAICVFIKNKNVERKENKIYFSELWGSREKKYRELEEQSIQKIKWSIVSADFPNYFFVPHNICNKEYSSYLNIESIFISDVSGIQTGRDEFVSKITDEDFAKWIGSLTSTDNSVDTLTKIVSLPEWNGFKLSDFRAKIKNKDYLESVSTEWLYRPFDIRPILFSPDCIKRTRGSIMSNLLSDNLGLISTRQLAKEGFSHIFVTKNIGDGNTISLNTREYNYYFPLYLYTTPADSAGTLFAQTETTRRPNLAPAFIDAFSQKLGLRFIQDGQGDLKSTFGPEDVFYYTYAVFHSPTYRTRYAEFLKIDFPRLPLTGNQALFARLVALGKELVELHLLKSAKVDEFITSYPVPGGGLVDRVKYEPSASADSLARSAGEGRGEGGGGEGGSVWINPQQYFGGVPEEVWNFKIGGYQVCDKWLKDRKGRVLSAEDITHYQRVVVALKETIRLMAEVDQAIPKWPME